MMILKALAPAAHSRIEGTLGPVERNNREALRGKSNAKARSLHRTVDAPACVLAFAQGDVVSDPLLACCQRAGDAVLAPVCPVAVSLEV